MIYKNIDKKAINKGLDELMKLTINQTASTLKKGGTLRRMRNRDHYRIREEVAKKHIDTEGFNKQYKESLEKYVK